MQNSTTISNIITFISFTSVFPEIFWFLLTWFQDLNVSLNKTFSMKALLYICLLAKRSFQGKGAIYSLKIYLWLTCSKRVGLWYRSSCPEVFCKKGVLRNFAKFTGKDLCLSLFFNKVAGLRTPFLIEHLQWLLLVVFWRIAAVKEIGTFFRKILVMKFFFSKVTCIILLKLPYFPQDFSICCQKCFSIEHLLLPAVCNLPQLFLQHLNQLNMDMGFLQLPVLCRLQNQCISLLQWQYLIQTPFSRRKIKSRLLGWRQLIGIMLNDRYQIHMVGKNMMLMLVKHHCSIRL